MSFVIIEQDITELEVDVIVNSINSKFLRVGGEYETILNKAGKEQLLDLLKLLPPIKDSEAVITDGFDLYAKKIIHTVGPVFKLDNPNESKQLLEETYLNCLNLVVENNFSSIAFPLISSGEFGFPKDQVLQIACQTITNFLNNNELNVILTIFDKESFELNQDLVLEVESYISENYVSKNYVSKPKLNIFFEKEQKEQICELSNFSCLEHDLENLDEPFSQTLLNLIDQKGKTDVEVYKKANIDRKLFSKIRTGKGYTPSKKTILALSISLELDLNETTDLLKRAGFTLSHSKKFDVIIEYFIKNGKYNIFEINEVLFKYDQILLGG